MTGSATERDSIRPLWQRILYLRIPLPLSLRGYFPGVEEQIAHSGLPAELRPLVALVVKRTRLWSGERSDVARELIAHFADGLEVGRTAAELARDFGDAKTAARLIRRAKRRNRHWLWHAQRRIGQGFGVLLLAIAVFYLRFWLGTPTLSHNYIAEMNAKIAQIPETDRAWPVYRRGLLALPVWPAQLADPSVIGQRRNRKTLDEVRPADPEWAMAKGYWESAQPALELIRRAAHLPSPGTPASSVLAPQEEQLALYLATVRGNRGVSFPPPVPEPDNPPLINVRLPELSSLRLMARLLAADAWAAADQGNADRCEADLSAILGIAEHCRAKPFLTSELVAAALANLQGRAVLGLLEQYPNLFGRERLARLAHALSAFHADASTLERALLHERMFFEDFLQRVFTDDGHGDGRVTPAGLRFLSGCSRTLSGTPGVQSPSGPDLTEFLTSPFALASRRQQLAEYDRVLASARRALERPPWEDGGVDDHADPGASWDSPLWRGKFAPVALMCPAFEKSGRNVQGADYTRQAVLCALAVHASKADRGSWPEDLGALVPSYLPSLPLDMFDGKPLKYRLSEGSFLLYSIGSNRVDDGGAPTGKGDKAGEWFSRDAVARARESNRASPIPPGDWIFFPPSRAHTDQRARPAPN